LPKNYWPREHLYETMQNKKEKNHSLSEVKDAHSFTVIDLLILKDESMSDSFCLREEEGARDNTG